jgi:hypothetical protein
MMILQDIGVSLLRTIKAFQSSHSTNMIGFPTPNTQAYSVDLANSYSIQRKFKINANTYFISSNFPKTIQGICLNNISGPRYFLYTWKQAYNT